MPVIMIYDDIITIYHILPYIISLLVMIYHSLSINLYVLMSLMSLLREKKIANSSSALQHPCPGRLWTLPQRKKDLALCRGMFGNLVEIVSHGCSVVWLFDGQTSTWFSHGFPWVVRCFSVGCSMFFPDQTWQILANSQQRGHRIEVFAPISPAHPTSQIKIPKA